MTKTAKKKAQAAPVDPAYLAKQRASLLRRRRVAVLFNEREMAAIDEYCSRFKISAKSAMIRQAVMERILKDLDENHPTLF